MRDTGRVFILNDTSNLTFSGDLAGRQTVGGPVETVWGKRSDYSECSLDLIMLMVASYLKNLDGGADPGRTVNGAHSFAPSSGSVGATGVVTNVDYRTATITLSASTGLTVGDRVSFGTSYSVGLSSKNSSGEAMNFCIVGISRC